MNVTLNKKILSIFLFICLFLYQYGYNYHLSFGSIGLFFIIAIGYKYKTSASINLSILIPILITTCFIFHLIKYGESDFFARMMRYCFTAWALYYLLNSLRTIPPPPESILLVGISILFYVAWYQNFIDPYFKAPNEYMALKTYFLDSDILRTISIEQFEGKLRASGLYTEPSVLALVSSCILFIALNSAKRFILIIIILTVCTVVLSGSLLGYIGVFGILFIKYKKKVFTNKKVLLVFLIFLPLALFALMLLIEERSAGTGKLLDGSTMTRLVYPFVIIIENFKNFDFLGYCGDLYTHYLYLNIYDTPGNFPGHNGFLAMIQNYGIFGVAMLLILFKRLNSSLEYFIIFLIGSQSGNFFSYEKVFLMVYMVLVYRHHFQAQLASIEQKTKLVTE